MFNFGKSTRKLAISALIAALYAALSLLLAPLSFGTVQMRVAEMLSLLPVFGGSAVIGVTLGCSISNAVGVVAGANILGAFDILFGTLATFISALLSHALRNVRIKGMCFISAIPPILINALIIGCELCFATTGSMCISKLYTFVLYTAAGQLLPCIAGVFIVRILEKRGLGNRF